MERQQGTVVVKDLDIATDFTDLDGQETLLMNAEFKLSINAYLSDLLHSPVRSLAEVIAFNEAHPVEVNQIVFLSSTLQNQPE
jgi:amidase